MIKIKNETTEIRQRQGQAIALDEAHRLIGLAMAGGPMPEVTHMTFADLAKTVLNQRPQRGFTTDEMRKRIRVMDALDEANEVIELEDADFDKLTECLQDFRWGLMHSDILAFEDAVELARDDELS